MAPALILTEEKAAEHGYMGAGPFTFPGGFPGVFVPGKPLALSETGFSSEEEAQAALDETGIPLEWTEVEEGEGLAERDNHALAADQAVEVEAAEVRAIKTHADADAAAAELGISFKSDPRPTVAEKIATIKAVRLGEPGNPDHLMPAHGAAESTPGAPEEGGS